MIKRSLLTVTLTAGLVALAGALSAQSSLKDEPSVRDGIIFVGMAYEISQRCDTIDARIFRGIGYLQTLKRRARDLGYSDAEIEAYVNDDAEERRLTEVARGQLALLGVDTDENDSYCAVGRAQIAAGTRVGWLLR